MKYYIAMFLVFKQSDDECDLFRDIDIIYAGSSFCISK